MKIKTYAYSEQKYFCKLSPGDVFLYDDHIFMVTDSYNDERTYKSISMQTGRVSDFWRAGTLVMPIPKATLYLEG